MKAETCSFPSCRCPFDPGPEPWCARSLPQPPTPFAHARVCSEDDGTLVPGSLKLGPRRIVVPADEFNPRDWLDTQPAPLDEAREWTPPYPGSWHGDVFLYDKPVLEFERQLDRDADAWFWWVMAGCALAIGFGAGLVVGWVKGWFV